MRNSDQKYTPLGSQHSFPETIYMKSTKCICEVDETPEGFLCVRHLTKSSFLINAFRVFIPKFLHFLFHRKRQKRKGMLDNGFESTLVVCWGQSGTMSCGIMLC